MQSVRCKFVTPASIAANYLVMWFDTPQEANPSRSSARQLPVYTHNTPSSQTKHDMAHWQATQRVMVQLFFDCSSAVVEASSSLLLQLVWWFSVMLLLLPPLLWLWMDGNMVFIGNDKRVLEATRTINHRTARGSRLHLSLAKRASTRGHHYLHPSIHRRPPSAVLHADCQQKIELWKIVINFEFLGSMKNWPIKTEIVRGEYRGRRETGNGKHSIK